MRNIIIFNNICALVGTHVEISEFYNVIIELILLLPTTLGVYLTIFQWPLMVIFSQDLNTPTQCSDCAVVIPPV